MKKLLTLLLAGGLLLSCAAPVSAIDFKARGSWQFALDYINGGAFMNKTRGGKNLAGQQWAAVRQNRDEFEAVQRLHLQLEAIASESLSGTVFFEIGEQRWGMGAQGGALGSDGVMVKVKQAFVDWAVPGVPLKLRMGIQGVKLPGFAIDSPVLQDDVAGITATYTFNSSASLTATWLRPYNDNWTGTSDSPANYMDNMDLFGLLLPLSFDGVKVTPWAMGGSMGPNTIRNPAGDTAGSNFRFSNHSMGQPIDGWQIQDGLFPVAFSSRRPSTSLFPREYNNMFWGGITADITLASPWRFSADFIYGGVDNGRQYLNRAGWYGMLLAEYRLDWAAPGLYGWYFSGDDDNPENGSERLPYLATTNNLTNSLSTFGYRGNPIMGGGKGVLGTNPSGTWGVGARLKDMSFMENLQHTLRVNFFGGTNAEGMAGYITGRKTTDGAGRRIYRNNRAPNAEIPTDFNSFGTYLTTADTGLEVNFDTAWKPYDNLTVLLETGYIHLWLDSGVWGKYGNIPGNSLSYKDAWKASLNFIYAF